MKQFNLEEYLANPLKKVVTRGGRDVRIICTDFNNPNFPVIGEVKGIEWPCGFTTKGTYNRYEVGDSDLFFAPEKHEGWINLYKWDNSTRYYVSKPFDSEEEAMEFSRKDDNYLKTLKIEWEE